MKPTFEVVADAQLTGRYVVTFRKDTTHDGLELLRDQAGLRDLVRASDFDDRAIHVEQAMQADGAVFDELDVCVVNCPKTVAQRIHELAPQSSIIAVEPEHRISLLDENESLSALDHYFDTANRSWAIRATKVEHSRFSGKGIKVAVLDSGIDAKHPDVVHGNIGSQRSFLSDGDVHDEDGHGTHCAGTICGPRHPTTVPGYGVAHDANLMIGKVVDKDGHGSDRSVLAGLNWAIANGCHVVSLSIGANTDSASTAFEQVGRRALDAGMLILAAAGNNSNRREDEFGFVVRPGNNRSIMAVGAVDRDLQIANFSARSSKVTGGEVDIVAPGIEVFSAWPLPVKYRAVNGTSMATPLVAGIAALYAEADNLRGLDLWNRLVATARSLPAGVLDVGAGLAQAPQ